MVPIPEESRPVSSRFLELDDGTVIAETSAICELIEEIHPDPPLIGRTPTGRAQTRMWVRRVELRISEPIINGFRFAEGRAFWEGRGRVIPERPIA